MARAEALFVQAPVRFTLGAFLVGGKSERSDEAVSIKERMSELIVDLLGGGNGLDENFKSFKGPDFNLSEYGGIRGNPNQTR